MQDYIEEEFGARVPKTSYDIIWERLEEQLGEDQAVDVVCEVVLATTTPRVEDLLDEAERDGDVDLRASEPKMVDLLFDTNGQPTELGTLILDYRAKSRAEVPPDATPDAEPKLISPDELPTHVRFGEIMNGPTQSGLASAAPGTGWRLERVRASAGTFLKADPRWRESHFEDFIVEKWSRIDFGLEKPLLLTGRQVRLKGTREKVDLVARTPDGVWVAVELKIVPANGADLTQLLSYMQDLAFAGIPREKIRGILLAPGFAEKVLNAAGSDRRVLLLRYLSER